LKKIVIIGGVGNGTVISSTIEDCKRSGQDIECVGFLNDNEMKVDDYDVLGGIKNMDWKKLPSDYFFIYALSSAKQAFERHKLLNELAIPPDRFATVVHPTAVVSDHVSLGRGVAIMPQTFISPGVRLGNHSQLFAQGFIGHNTIIGEMVFLTANSHTGSWIVIENGAHIGIMSTSMERITIGKYSIIGAGALVTRDVPEYTIVVGSPAKVLRKISPSD